MSDSTAASRFIDRWVKENNPSLFANVARPTFINLRVESDDGAFNQVFMRSKFSMDNIPGFAAGLTTKGSAEVTLMSSARTQAPYFYDGSYVFGPVGSRGTKKKLNEYPNNSFFLALKAKLADMGPHRIAQSFVSGSVLNYNTTTVETMKKSYVYLYARIALLYMGCTGITEPEYTTPEHGLAHTSNGWSDNMQWAFPADKMVIYFEGNAGGIIAKPMFFLCDKPDDVSQCWVPRRSFDSQYDNSVHVMKVALLTGKPTDSAIYPLHPSRVEQADATAVINSEYVVNYNVGTQLNLNHQPFQQIDDNWIPISTAPGNHSLVVISPKNSTVITKFATSDYDLITIDCADAEVAGKIPLSWWDQYADRAVARNEMTAADAASSKTKRDENGPSSLTFVSYMNPVFLPENLVDLTATAIAYRKAREKACEDDDFLEQEFVTSLTYGQLRTRMNGSRSVKVIYGFLDDTVEGKIGISHLPTEATQYTNVTISLGSAVVTATNGRSYTAANVDEMLELVSGGALLTGGTLTAQWVIWGLDDLMMTTAMSDLISQGYATRFVDKYRTSTMDKHNYNWEAVSAGGYPDYKPYAGTERGYKIAMVSAGVARPVGEKLVRLMFKDLRAQFTKYAYAASA